MYKKMIITKTLTNADGDTYVKAMSHADYETTEWNDLLDGFNNHLTVAKRLAERLGCDVNSHDHSESLDDSGYVFFFDRPKG